MNGVNVVAWVECMSEAFARDCQVNVWMDKMRLLVAERTRGWIGDQWSIRLWTDKSECGPLRPQQAFERFVLKKWSFFFLVGFSDCSASPSGSWRSNSGKFWHFSSVAPPPPPKTRKRESYFTSLAPFSVSRSCDPRSQSQKGYGVCHCPGKQRKGALHHSFRNNFKGIPAQHKAWQPAP